jgi:GNAT superfamily N-acetyltransferase
MTAALKIIRVDPYDIATYDAWWTAYADAERADRGEQAPVWTLEESRVELQQVTPQIDRRAFIAVRGEQVVGSAKLGLPLKDNTHRAGLGVDVPLPFRRQGIGSALLAEVERQAAQAGRTTLSGEASWPYAAGPDGSGVPAREFARGHGYQLALGDVCRRLELPVAGEHLDQLATEAARRHGGYSLHSWKGPIPEQYVAGWAALDASLETEAPVGELDLQPSTADVEEVRRQEALLVEQRRTSYGTVALDPAGNVVAYSELVVSGHDGNAYQWGTLVRSDHRGHRLGLAVKAANLRILQDHDRAVPAVITYNAEVNRHMIGVNDRLGFTPVERLGEFQKKLRSE